MNGFSAAQLAYDNALPEDWTYTPRGDDSAEDRAEARAELDRDRDD